MFIKRVLVFIFSFFLLTTICIAQKSLAMDTYKLIGFKRIHYNTGDKISFSLKGEKTKYSGEILEITDSTIDIQGLKVPLTMIGIIYRDKSNFLLRDFSKVFVWCGAGFILLDTDNNLINKNPTVIDERAVIAGGSLMIIGWTMRLLSLKKYRINNRRILKVIDLGGYR